MRGRGSGKVQETRNPKTERGQNRRLSAIDAAAKVLAAARKPMNCLILLHGFALSQAQLLRTEKTTFQHLASCLRNCDESRKIPPNT